MYLKEKQGGTCLSTITHIHTRLLSETNTHSHVYYRCFKWSDRLEQKPAWAAEEEESQKLIEGSNGRR